MRVAGWLSADHLHGFFWANAALLAIAAAATAVCLYLLDPRRALWFALAPSLALEAFLNWDLLAVSLAAAGTLAFFRRRDGWAGALLGLGAAAKLYPALLLVPFAADRLRARQPDAAIRLWWSAAAAWVLVNAPFAIGGPRGWWEFFRFNAARPLDWDSLWTLACRLSACASIPVANVIGVVATAAITAVIWAEKRRREPEFPRWQLVFPLLIAFLLTGKVYSPQFSLWLLPWFALVEGDVRRFVAFEVADVAVFFTRLSFFAGYTGFGGAPRWVFEVAVVIRASVLVWCVVAWVRRPTRSLPPERSPVPVVAA
jgi:uncharacterized membrane protein